MRRSKIDYATLDHLRALALDIVDPLLALLAMHNRPLQILTLETKIEIKDEIVASLGKLEIDEKRIRLATVFLPEPGTRRRASG